MSHSLSAVDAGQRRRRKRHPNHRLVKIHRSYTVEEVARLFGGHRNTVRHWIKRGLPTVDDKRPTLILGRELAEFLQGLRQKNKRKCQPGEIYCVGCRAPQKPAGDMAEYKPLTPSLGNLVAICPVCDAMIYRRINPAKLQQVCGNLNVTVPQVGEHISESSRVSVNCAFRKG
ncbi:MAG: helix-turn-helix domain-containing protein [Deltaproteobacteria bacterium]|nr:helix-turn-helix domain-containing protein [Deltaproteobacteria bacterium]